MLHKHCMPLCLLPVRKTKATTPGRRTTDFSTWSFYNNIQANIEHMDGSHGVTKSYNNSLANLENKFNTNFTPFLTDSEQILLECNRNQMISEYVFNHFNGNVFAEEGGYLIPDRVKKRSTEDYDKKTKNHCINSILADFVENEIYSMENIRRSFDDQIRCECAIMDGKNVTYEREMGTKIPEYLSKETLRHLSSHCFNKGHSKSCDWDFIDFDSISGSCQNCTLGELRSAWIRQNEAPYREISTAEKLNVVDNNGTVDHSKNCICCFGSNHAEHDAMSEENVNISKDFKNPRHSSTPISKTLSNPVHNRSSYGRKIKKHCTTHCSHEKIEPIDPNYGDTRDHECEKVFLMDENNIGTGVTDVRMPSTSLRGSTSTYSMSNADCNLTSQYCRESIQKSIPNDNSLTKSDNKRNMTGEYKFQTIEILQDPERNLAYTSMNRLKKPCFKVHNKMETDTGATIVNNVNGLENIVEDETEELKTQNESNKNRDHEMFNSGFENKSLSKLNSETSHPPNCEINRKVNIDENHPFRTNKILEINDGVSKTVDTLSTASYPLRRKIRSNRSASVDTLSLCSEKTIDELYIKYRGKSKKKSSREEMRMKQSTSFLMLITEDYYNDDDKFQVTKDEIVVLLNVYKSWLYVQTHKHQNGFIPSYIAAYAVV